MDGNWKDGAIKIGEHRGEVRCCQVQPQHPDPMVTLQNLFPRCISPTTYQLHVGRLFAQHTLVPGTLEGEAKQTFLLKASRVEMLWPQCCMSFLLV